MLRTVFTFQDSDRVRWIGINHGLPDGIWLYYQHPKGGYAVSVRQLSEQEVEEYQRIAGNYVRV
jgi:hypothetical protein